MSLRAKILGFHLPITICIILMAVTQIVQAGFLKGPFFELQSVRKLYTQICHTVFMNSSCSPSNESTPDIHNVGL